MSYKSIDLQSSFPRTAEMSPLQHQQQQRPATEQSLLGQQVVKTAEQQARRSVKTDSTSNNTVSERQPRNRSKQSTSSNKQGNQEATEEDRVSEHPYKGKHIDFVG
jgi:hypothetical protein